MLRGMLLLMTLLAIVTGSAGIFSQPFTRQEFTRRLIGAVFHDIAITPKGGWIYIIGDTADPSYPTTPRAFGRTCGTDGDCNPFVDSRSFRTLRNLDVAFTVLDPTGQVHYSTFLGGRGIEHNARLVLRPSLHHTDGRSVGASIAINFRRGRWRANVFQCVG